MIPHLVDVAPKNFRRYYEPFAGSACLFFAIHPASAVIGDLNSDLIQAYEVITRHPRKVARRTKLLAKPGHDYYAIRATQPDELKSIDRAARFVYLNRHCFNGLYRINRNGAFNVPLGSNLGSIPSEGHFYRCAFALRSATLRAMDYAETIADVGRGDFVYMDPPYRTKRRNYGEYGYGVFSAVDLPRFADDAKRLVAKGAHVVVSYAHDRELLGLLGGWQRHTVRVWRGMAGEPTHRVMTREMMLISPTR